MQKNDEGKNADFLLGALAGTALALMLLYIFTVLIAERKIPERFSEGLVIVSALFGSALSGAVAARRQGRGAVQSGLAGGFVFYLLLLVCGAISSGGFEANATTAKLAAGSAAGGILGGLAGTSQAFRRKQRRGR